jgi:hypothetical protein
VPEDLAQFADLLDDDLHAIRDTWERLRSEFDKVADPNFPGSSIIGVAYHADRAPGPLYDSDGIYEAKEFYKAYERTVMAERFLMEDVIKGLETLRDGARKIHDRYVDTDAANADDLEGAFALYKPWAVTEVFEEPDHKA